MSNVETRGVLFVHSSPHALSPHIEWAAGSALRRAVNFQWTDQPVMKGMQRTVFPWQGAAGTGALIASALRGWEHLRFEVTEEATRTSDAGRWMHTPDLGIYYSVMDAAGNAVVPEDRIRYAMEIAGSDVFELQRELRLALGQAWDDELEPFRSGDDSTPYIWLHKVG